MNFIPRNGFLSRTMAFSVAGTCLKSFLARFYIDPTHSQTKQTHPEPIRTIFNENLKFPKTSKPFSLHLNPLQRGVDPSQKIPDIILLRIHIFSSHDDPWRPHSSNISFLISVISLPCARRGFFGSEKTAIFFLGPISICVFTKKMRTAISCRTVWSTRRELSRGVHFFKKCDFINLDVNKEIWISGFPGHLISGNPGL